jgi:hypothetical protein
MERAIAYIDGFNLYFGLKAAAFERFLWLDVHALAANLLNPELQKVVKTNYFTSRISDPPDKVIRQQTYLEALAVHRPDISFHYGHYQRNVKTCMKCGHQHASHSEKMTDVNIACELLHDAFNDLFDVALLISADSDLAKPISKVRFLFPKKRVVAVFPPKRKSKHLRSLVNGVLDIKESSLAKSQMPDPVIRADGFALTKPSRWA